MGNVSTPLVPDFSSVVSELVTLPYRSEPYLRLSFSDPMLEGYEVTVIEDSLASGEAETIEYEKIANSLGLSRVRLTTVASRFPRPVLAEVNTHRVFSRNSASSRARSVKATIAEVMNNPYIPLFTNNQKGMGGAYVTAEVRERAVEAWLEARDSAVVSMLKMLLGDMMPDGMISEIAADYENLVDIYYNDVYNADIPDPLALSIHKQNANRLIEPFIWHEAIITSSYWDNYLDLRNHDEAQPEIKAMAVLIDAALRQSEAKVNWAHLPFIAPEDLLESSASFAEIRPVAMRSATESAQISYRDKSRAVKSNATSALGERLLGSKHFSPFEHVAFARLDSDFLNELGVTVEDEALRSNLDDSWIQLRSVLAVTS
jgi:hypothetical protein